MTEITTTARRIFATKVAMIFPFNDLHHVVGGLLDLGYSAQIPLDFSGPKWKLTKQFTIITGRRKNGTFEVIDYRDGKYDNHLLIERYNLSLFLAVSARSRRKLPFPGEYVISRKELCKVVSVEDYAVSIQTSQGIKVLKPRDIKKPNLITNIAWFNHDLNGKSAVFVKKELKSVNTEKLNTIVSIGYMGLKTCYVNVTKEEAQRRFLLEDPDFSDVEEYTDEIEFTDQFRAYTIWSHEK